MGGKDKTSPVGRPTKLTASLQRAYCRQLQTGCTRETAAASIGVDVGTVCKWLQRGRSETEGQFFQFRQAVEGAHAAVVQKLLKAAHRRVMPKSKGGERTLPAGHD